MSGKNSICFPSTDAFRFISTAGGVVGWIRRDLPEDLFADFIRDPDRFLSDPSSRILKNGPKAKVVKQTLKERGGVALDVVIKRFHYGSLFRRIGFYFVSSPAIRSLQGALVLSQEGLDTAFPLAAFKRRDWRGLGTSYYVSEDIKGGRSLIPFWRDVVARLPRQESLGVRRQVLKELAFLFYKLHYRGIYHHDLKGGNILIRGPEKGKWQCFIVDVEGVRKRRWLAQTKKVKNLVQLYRTLGKWLNIVDKVYFLKCYAHLSSLSRQDRKAIARRVLAVSRKEDIRSLRK